MRPWSRPAGVVPAERHREQEENKANKYIIYPISSVKAGIPDTEYHKKDDGFWLSLVSFAHYSEKQSVSKNNRLVLLAQQDTSDTPVFMVRSSVVVGQ